MVVQPAVTAAPAASPVEKEEKTTVTIIPDPGYRLVRAVASSHAGDFITELTPIGGNKYTFPMHAEGVELYVTFEEILNPVTVKAGARGTASADVAQAKVGDTVTYTVKVTNSGNVTVKGIALSDTLVTLSEEAFDLAPNGTKTVTYTYTVTQADVDAGKIDNTATATGKDPSNSDVTASDDATVKTVEADAKLAVTKTASKTSGAAVVCEEMCTGTRYFTNLVDETKTTLDEQFMALSERYMKTNCACFTPNTGRIDDILALVKEYKVDGVIDCSLKFCCLYDTEKYSVSRALKEAGVPVLSLETDYEDADAGQLRTRIGAFIEMLG